MKETSLLISDKITWGNNENKNDEIKRSTSEMILPVPLPAE